MKKNKKIKIKVDQKDLPKTRKVWGMNPHTRVQKNSKNTIEGNTKTPAIGNLSKLMFFIS